MRRSWLILLAVTLAAGGVIGLSYSISRCVCARQMAASQDDLEWLRTEFHLGAPEMDRIRQLHEGYLPQCRETCSQIALKKETLQHLLTATNGVTSEVEQTLADIASLRVQCQTRMLRHFEEVSRAMPPEQGARYLAEMRRLTLGGHEKIESSMSGMSPHSHGHH